MLLAIDAGNSSIAFGLLQGEEVVTTWRFETARGVSKKELESHLPPGGIEAAILGSVVPRLNEPLAKTVLEATGKTLHIARRAETGLELKVEEPARVGIDRILDALAGRLYFGTPLIVIDFGTATTFNVLDKSGAFLGGAIAAGIGTGLESLTSKAAQLPDITFRETDKVIGRNTREAMGSAAWFGTLSLIEGMVKRLKTEVGKGTKVVATGGYCTAFEGKTPAIDHVRPDLTLQGLRLVYQKVAA